MRDVIRESGLSAGAIYRYFTGKDEIIEAITAERHARELAVITAARHDADGAPALRRIAREFFATLADPAERRFRRLGIQIWAEALRDPAILRTVRRGIDQPRAALAALVRDAGRRGEAPDDLDPDVAARIMIALFHGFVLQQAWDPRLATGPYVAALERALDAALDGARSARPRQGPHGIGRARATRRARPRRGD